MSRSNRPPLYVLGATSMLFASTLLLRPDKDADSSQSAEPGVLVLPQPLAAAELENEPPPLRDGATKASARHAVGPATTTAGIDQPPASDEPQAHKETSTQSSSKSDARVGDAKSTAPQLHTTIGSVEIFPTSNEWNRRVDALPVHQLSPVWLRSIGLDKGLHPDFGTTWRGVPNGIPFVVVRPEQPKVAVAFEYADESDPGPYPIPPNPPIEGGRDAPWDSDRHVIMIDPQQRRLYELYQLIPDPIVGWRAGSGAIFDLSRNHDRPEGWTSADAAGLPIFPGLVRYDEVAAGEIRHALRFTVVKSQRAYIFPARHFASRSSDPNLPPMGLRVRLRADFDVSKFPPGVRVILTALQRYGMLLADNGSDWFISGAPDPRWNDSELATLKQIKGRDLECVVTGELNP
ncbi:hypothetical protein GC176_11050 [bacterium]|nr:hypothetical protein [bacterium]